MARHLRTCDFTGRCISIRYSAQFERAFLLILVIIAACPNFAAVKRFTKTINNTSHLFYFSLFRHETTRLANTNLTSKCDYYFIGFLFYVLDCDDLN